MIPASSRRSTGSAKHWTLEENPGMGQQGVYLFLQRAAKALAVYGQ